MSVAVLSLACGVLATALTIAVCLLYAIMAFVVVAGTLQLDQSSVWPI